MAKIPKLPKPGKISPRKQMAASDMGPMPGMDAMKRGGKVKKAKR